MTIAAPKQDRFTSIDTLRGFAVLGILMMNVQLFAMHDLAYQYPPAHMDLTGDNLLVRFIQHVFFEVKFMTIFSALFGAGMLLMLGDGGPDRIALHRRRMLWLLIIGLIHGYVFWMGDILAFYAIGGFLIVFARNWAVGKLVVIGGLLVAATGLLTTGLFASFNLIPGELDPTEIGMAPTAEDLQSQIALYQSGFVERMPYNAMHTLFGQIGGLLIFGGRIFGNMLLGMALFRIGFFTLKWSMAQYFLAALVTLGVGLPASWIGGSMAVNSEYALEQTWLFFSINYGSSLIVAFGYAAVVMLLSKIGVFKLVLYPFTAAGRMAFTNYLSQTLIMTYLFVGPPGLGWFGTMERVEQAQLVIMVWIGQLIFSVFWLSVFRFGPFEWLWRSLTYGKQQPIFKTRSSEPTTPSAT